MGFVFFVVGFFLGGLRMNKKNNNNKKYIKKQQLYIYIYHIIYKSSNRNKVRDKFGITYFEKLITMQIRSRD